MDRRKVLQTTGAAVGSGLMLGATGTAAASGNGTAKGNSNAKKGKCNVEEISRKGGTIVTLVEVFDQKFLFREATAYRNADSASPQADATAYEATESGYPVEFQKIGSANANDTESSISASDINSDGSIQVQAVDFTPENFIKRYDVDTKTISNSCGDIAFSSHHALEFHFEGGGAFSSIGVAGIAGVLCYAAGATAAIPTGGLSGAAAAGLCSMFTTAVDALIDVDMIPNNVEMSAAFWDQDEDQIVNTSPTIAMGLAPGWEVDWYQMAKIGEYDNNVHLGLGL